MQAGLLRQVGFAWNDRVNGTQYSHAQFWDAFVPHFLSHQDWVDCLWSELDFASLELETEARTAKTNKAITITVKRIGKRYFFIPRLYQIQMVND
jgi:hypothetical protein